MHDAAQTAGARSASTAARARGGASPAAVFAAAMLVPLSLAALAAPLHAQDFTLEEVLSSPMPSGLVASPNGTALAWVQNREGVRNIWVANGPDYRGRRVTGYEEDDGYGISNLAFSPDGDAIVFRRGGGANAAGDFPNPTSDPDGPVDGIWVVPVDGSAEPRRLAGGGSPAVSPRDDIVAFARGGIRTVALDDPDAEPEQVADVRSGAGSLRWSPDGSRIAFVSRRGEHAFVGVLDLADRTIRWLDPGIDRDVEPVWSPDGSEIAFLRVPDDGDPLPFTPRRTAERPWSIVVADAATGDGRVVWTADEGYGSVFRGVDADRQLLWTEDDRLVFPWEKNGWLHLWSVPVDGSGDATPLTPGEFEVKNVALGADGRTILYSSNQDDIDRKHLWWVRARGGSPPRPLTGGDGIEWSPVPTSDGEAVAFLASDATTPAHAEVLVDGERRPLAPGGVPAGFPSDELVTPEQVVFLAADGMRIHGQLFRPRGLDEGERAPAVVFFHGGSRRQMLLGFHDRGYYHNAYAMNQYLAGRGYIVLAINYRSGIGYGLEFREAENYGAAGASEFHDVMGAGLYLQSRADVDPDRIGLWGGSYGGYLTALGLARASDLFAAGVDLHGVHDWNEGIQNFRPDYERVEHPEFARRAFEASPMASLETWRSPVLLIHGDDDRNVRFSETVTLANELVTRGVEVETLVFPDEVHGFLLHRNWLAAYRAAADFFDRKLRGARTAAR